MVGPGLFTAAEARKILREAPGVLAGDVTSAADVERAVAGCDLVFHVVGDLAHGYARLGKRRHR